MDALLLAGADKDVIEEATGATPLLLAAQLGHAPVPGSSAARHPIYGSTILKCLTT